MDGCYTTSHLHGIGKGASLKKFKECDIFREQTEVIHAHSTSKDDVAEVGEKPMLILHNGKSSSTYIQPQVLLYLNSKVSQPTCLLASARMD